MQLFAYPGERVDFVSKSSSAGALEFGDTIELVEEFFGPAHAKTPPNDNDTLKLTYYNGSLAFEFIAGKLCAINVEPALSKEKIEIFIDRELVTSDTSTDSLETTKRTGVEATFDNGLKRIRFSV